ncbi:hypothetical protein ABIE56_000350 [Luteibacter sp. 621]|uniref:P-loop NTPase fold protein n=1 Tax=Luteibacter sp. 621 TaxID=3373916 RepID=UPI003D2282B4
MTTFLARAALTRFVTDQRAAAVALTGPWGSGKTWLWNDVVSSLSRAPDPGFSRYSYVSLFGLNSMADLKAALFENAVPPGSVQTGATPESLATEMKHIFKAETVQETGSKLGRFMLGKGRQHAQTAASFLPPWASALRSATFLAVRDYVICIDDVERKGKDLSMTDVLGLVSYLREQRQCRVVLILNEDGLGPTGSGERDLFTGFREKVLEREVVFHPTVAECTDLVFGGTKGAHAMAGHFAAELGITNLRILQRIVRAVDDFMPFIANSPEAVQTSLARTVALLVWCHYGEAAGAPGYSFSKKILLTHFAGVMETDKLTDTEAAWMETLWTMGGHLYHGLVAEVCGSLERGYINTDAVEKAVSDATAQAALEAASGSMKDAWALLHNSFADNTDVFVETMMTTALANAPWLGYAEAETVCVLLRELSEGDKADELAREWERVNASIDPARLEVPEDFLGSRAADPMFRAEALRRATGPVRPTLADTIREQADKSGWNPIDIEVLSTATVDEYVAFFLNAGPDAELFRYVHACLHFARTQSPEAAYVTIAQTASAALRIIAAMSPLNAVRVAKFPMVPALVPLSPPPAPINPFVVRP